MAFFKWDDQYSVGVAEIDQQHKGLVNTINILFDALAAGKGNDVLGQLINDLVRYTVVHFETEEKYFDKFNYEFSDEHKAEHQKFKIEVAKFQAGFKAGEILLSMDVFKFLKEWISTHVNGSDQKYSKCFTENGLQ